MPIGQRYDLQWAKGKNLTLAGLLNSMNWVMYKHEDVLLSLSNSGVSKTDDQVLLKCNGIDGACLLVG